MIENRRMMLRSLRGAPLSVLVCLFMFGPSNRKEMISATGWQKGVIDSALRSLEDMGLVVRPSYRRWSLSDGCVQLGLFNYPLNGPSASEQVVDNIPEDPLNGLSKASSRLVRSKLKKEDSVILDVCTELGIVGRKRLKLASLDHVSQGGREYVEGHVGAADNLGQAIWRMEQGWSVPGGAKKRPSKSVVPHGYKLIDGQLVSEWGGDG